VSDNEWVPPQDQHEAFERARAAYEQAQAALQRWRDALRLGQHDGPESAEFSARARTYFQASRAFHNLISDQTDLHPGWHRAPTPWPQVVPEPE
jgi:hypothetical protein